MVEEGGDDDALAPMLNCLRDDHATQQRPFQRRGRQRWASFDSTSRP